MIISTTKTCHKVSKVLWVVAGYVALLWCMLARVG